MLNKIFKKQLVKISPNSRIQEAHIFSRGLLLIELPLVYNPLPPLFDLNIVYSYVIEVADSESDLGLHGRALVSEIFVFYHLLEYAQGRPGRRGHVHLGHNFSIQNYFFKMFYVYYVHEGSEGVCRVFTFEGVCRVFTLEGVYRYLLLRVYIGIYFEGVCRVFTLRVCVGYLL